MRLVTAFICILITWGLSAQSLRDSLDRKLMEAPSDTVRFQILYGSCFQILGQDPALGLDYANQYLELARKNRDSSLVATGLWLRGILHTEGYQYKKAIQSFYLSRKTATHIRDTGLIKRALSALAVLHGRRQETKEAMGYLKEAMHLDSIAGKKISPTDFQNLGNLYEIEKKYDNALTAYKSGLKSLDEDVIAESTSRDLKRVRGSLYQNIATLHNALYRNVPDSEKVNHQNLLDSVEMYSKRGRLIHVGIDDMKGVAYCDFQLGDVASWRGDHRKALEYYLKVAPVLREQGALGHVRDLYNSIASTYEQLGDVSNQLRYYQMHVALKDSLLESFQAKELAGERSKYEIELRDTELERQKGELEKIEALNAKKDITLYASIAIGLLLLVFGGFMIQRVRLTNRQKATIEEQHLVLAERNKEMLDSLNYAQRLQSAILPAVSAIGEAFAAAFVIYEPKDIVAGDFFWFKNEEGAIWLAVGDCTGHGVPGAMVSVVCANALNNVHLEAPNLNPGDTLNKVRENVIRSLSTSDDNVRDGMDIALCKFNAEMNLLEFAGANNPLWVLKQRGDEISITKGDKQPIGKHENEHPFQTHQISVQKGDRVYLFSDGLVDQFGGPRGKKFKHRQLRELLVSSSDMSLIDQKIQIAETLHQWMGEHEQIDDICVIGVEV